MKNQITVMIMLGMVISLSSAFSKVYSDGTISINQDDTYVSVDR